MAVYLPIVTEFKDKGIKDAAKQFASLEGAGKKAQFAIQKAALPAAAALGGIAVAAVDAAKAAAEDQAAAAQLAGTLKNSAGATDAQTAAVEDWISKTSVAAAVADDELRPALADLVRGTKDVGKAQDLMSLALDISASTGKDVGDVAMALSKAYNGNTGALKKLDPALAGAIKAGATTEGVFANLENTFAGAADTAASSAQGQFKSMTIALGEAKESIGAALLPAITALVGKLTSAAQWVQKNSGLVLTLGAIIGGLAIGILAVNTAMGIYQAVQGITAAVNTVTGASFSALWVATGVGIILAVIAAIVVLQVKFNILGKAVDALKAVFGALWDAIKWGLSTAWDLIKKYVQLWTDAFGAIGDVFSAIGDAIVGAFKWAFNKVAKFWNDTVGSLGFTFPDWVPGLGGKGFNVPDIPMLAQGGVVTSPTLAMIGEAGPEAVVPLSKAGGLGATYITVTGALDPVAVARQLRDILNSDAKRSGRVVML